MARPRDLRAQIARLEANLSRALVGKAEVVRLAVVGLLARGHLLIEDVPGVGKTTLAAALARSIGAGFQRIQFTSDMLPSDVLGVAVYEPDKHEFVFKPGPIFTNIVLADEINRTTPKTQSSLLEAMNEAQVSLDHTTHALAAPVHGPRDPEPAGARGHVPAAGVAARPLPPPDPDRLPERGRRADDPARRGDAGRGDARDGARRRRRRRAPGGRRAGPGRRLRARLRPGDRDRDAPLAAARARREPARLARAPPRGARPRAGRRARLPRARRRQAPGGARARAPRPPGRATSADGAGAGAEAVIRTIVQDVPVPR